MGPIRVWIEGFLRGRYGYEGNRVYRTLAVPGLIGAILIAGWLLVGSLKASSLIPPIPTITAEGAVVRNGVAAVVVCGKKSGSMNEKGMMAVSDHAPEPRTGAWWPEQQGNCTVWYHRPPDWHQRLNRHERAQEERIGAD